MAKKSDKKDFFNLIIEETAKCIGPEKIFDPGTRTYDFKDDLKYTSVFFNMGYMLRDLVLQKNNKYKDKTNSSFGSEMLEKIIDGIYERVKNREDVIEERLDNYLTKEDHEFARKKLNKLLSQSKGKYKVILISDLVELLDIESVQVGKTTIKKINDKYLSDFPEKIENHQAASSLLGLVSPVVEKKDFLDKHKDDVAIEIPVEGYHFGKELSLVFYTALEEIKRTFAYLFMCRYFLDNVSKGQYKIPTKTIEKKTFLPTEEPVGLQEYFLIKDMDYKTLVKLDANFISILLSNQVITLSSEGVAQIKRRCCLDTFNKISNDKNMWGLKNKVNRAFDWFFKSVVDKNETDRVIGLFIGLETLLSTGQDYLSSHTDDMAENIAIMLTCELEGRYKYKKYFKKQLYPLRNAIMHHGENFSIDTDWQKLTQLKLFLVWSLRGILERLDSIKKYGNNSDALREYFEREKLSPSVDLSKLVKEKRKEGK